MNLWPRTLSGRLWENDGRGEACLLQREWESPRGRKGQTPLLRFCNPAMWLGAATWERAGCEDPQRAGRDSTAHGAPAAMIPRPVKPAFAAKRDWLTLVVPWAKGPRYNRAGETWQNA